MKTLVTFSGSLRIKPLERFTVYAVDFEGSLATGILEYGLVGTDSVDGIFSAETAFCKNKGCISDVEFERHRISEKQVAWCDDFISVVPRLAELRGKFFFCAHNAAFENALLNSYCPAVLNARSVASGTQASWGPWLDTCMLYKKHFKRVLRKQSVSFARERTDALADGCGSTMNEGNEREGSVRLQVSPSDGSETHPSRVLPSGNLQTLIEGCGLQGALSTLGERFCPPNRRHYHAALYDALACALLLLNFIRSKDVRAKTLPQLLRESASNAASETLQQPMLFH